MRRESTPFPATTRPQSIADRFDEQPSDPAPVGSGERFFGRSWRVWVGVGISAAFLLYAFHGQNLDDVWAALKRVDLRWLPPALALYFAGVWVRALRWSVLLRPVVRARAGAIFPVVVVGYTANNVLPLRTGELVRAYLLGRRYGVRKTAALATIAV